jgi:hypothetical protein
LFERINLTEFMFELPMFERLKWIQGLRSSGLVDDRLFWTGVDRSAEHIVGAVSA